MERKLKTEQIRKTFMELEPKLLQVITMVDFEDLIGYCLDAEFGIP